MFHLFPASLFLLLEKAVFRLEESHKGFVVVADKRNDKWASVRNMLLYISVSCCREFQSQSEIPRLSPGFLLKNEGWSLNGYWKFSWEDTDLFRVQKPSSTQKFPPQDLFLPKIRGNLHFWRYQTAPSASKQGNWPGRGWKPCVYHPLSFPSPPQLVPLLFSIKYIVFQSFFPGQIRLVLLLKPEGVLQRALEVGYRGVAENCSFKVSSFPPFLSPFRPNKF